MLDIRLIRERPSVVKDDLKKRGLSTRTVDELLKEDLAYRKLLKQLELLRHRRNLRTKEMATRTREGEKIDKYRKELKLLVGKIKKNEQQVEKHKANIRSLLYQLPNLLHSSVPKGKDDSDNKVVRAWGKKPRLTNPQGHEALATALGILDIERAAKISGARFYFLKNEGALLDLALQRFAVDFLLKKGFSLVQPPFLMRRGPYEGVVDLGDFEDVMYKVEDEDLYLIATSEHPLVAKYQNETLDQLPLKLAGISTNFRKEAGSHGKDTKGIFRVHQFNKIEQVVFCEPEDSWTIHEQLMKNTEHLFQALELPYQVVNVCTGDIGSIAAKKYDLNVWMPVQKTYREAASCSNATDYQARRLRIRSQKSLVHTLNNTALATSRTMVAILENFQQKNGSVRIPRVLRPHMNGLKKIESQ